MKKTVALLIALIMIFTSVPAIFAAEKDDDMLKFDSYGKFKIMLFADLHEDGTADEVQGIMMREALDSCKPDLVIYLGDNATADYYSEQYKAIEKITAPVRERNIPYAIVFGNHDGECDASKEELLKIYQSFDCLTYDAEPSIYGCGNCNLPIMSSDGSKTVFNLWLIDSGSYNTDEGAGGYDYVHKDQLEWYKRTAEKLKEENGGKVVPAFDFQHIVIPEIMDKLHVELPVSLGVASRQKFGKSYSLLPVFTRLNGYWLEECYPPDVYDGQLEAWKETGDVIAEFHGHDHNNSYNVNIDGVDVVNVPSVGGGAYSKDVSRGAGLITLYEDDIENYDYEIIHMYDLALMKNSEITDSQGAQSKSYYFLVKLLDTFVSHIFSVIRFLNIDRL